MQRIAFEKLKTADLFVDAVYESNGATNLNGDVLSKLMSVGTQGGFRPVNIRNQRAKPLILFLNRQINILIGLITLIMNQE